jgi:cytidylate kinase
MSKSFQIAIDGPVAAGKSTVSRKLAEALGFLYVDTGAMYRAVTLAAHQQNVDINSETALVSLVNNLNLEVRLPESNELDGRQSTVLLDEEDVSWAIRKGAVTRDVAKIAAFPKVRSTLVPIQQKIAAGKNVVMEGRDITYVVLPEADLKIYLDANFKIRVNRYLISRSAQKKSTTEQEARSWLKERDYNDKNRDASPLKIVPGVWVLDSSALTIDQVVDMIKERVMRTKQSND